jgi:hypothetical protein
MCAMSSDRDTAKRDPADLEQQAAQIRADMDRTLSALERKFSPEQLIDRSLTYFRDLGGELRQTVGATMRNNPGPIVLTLAGLTWLVTSSYNKRQPPGQDLQSRFSRSNVGQKLQERASSARERLHSAADSARQRFSRSGSSTEYGSSEYGDYGEYGATSSSGRFSNAMHSARDSARTRVSQAQDRVYNMLEEQPLVVGALAVAVGAIIGTAIPTTTYENRMLGPTRDRTLSKAQQLGEQQYEQLKETMQTQGSSTTGTQQSSGTESGLSGRA